MSSCPTPVKNVPNLFALNIDPIDAAREYRERVVGPYRGVLPEAAVSQIEEQLSGACTVEIAGFNEFSKLLGNDAAMQDYDHIILDTAPTGHTLRLLNLPSAWNDFIASNQTGSSCLGPIAGLKEQKVLFEQVVAALKDPASTIKIFGWPKFLRELEEEGNGVIMTMGKGGVGKTTMAAAIAAELAHRGHKVVLSTTDPAAHVAQTIEKDLPNLTVERIDPKAETKRYVAGVLEKNRSKLSEDDMALLEEDMRSPCIEEIAVFQAFAQTVAKGEKGFVVLDTAPTGHTLLLLDATQSYHREVAKSVDELPEAVKTLLPRVRDPKFTKVLIVALPEATPTHGFPRNSAGRKTFDIYLVFPEDDFLRDHTQTPVLNVILRNDLPTGSLSLADKPDLALFFQLGENLLDQLGAGRRQLCGKVAQCELLHLRQNGLPYQVALGSLQNGHGAFPKTTGRRRSGGIVMPSILFEDSTLWIIACSSKTSRSSGFWRIQRSCFPCASIQTPRSQPVPTDVCGPNVDSRLVAFAGALKQIASMGVTVERFNLAQQPQAFVENAQVKAHLGEFGHEKLPFIYLNDDLEFSGRYPEPSELFSVLGLNRGLISDEDNQPRDDKSSFVLASMPGLAPNISANLLGKRRQGFRRH